MCRCADVQMCGCANVQIRGCADVHIEESAVGLVCKFANTDLKGQIEKSPSFVEGDFSSLF